MGHACVLGLLIFLVGGIYAGNANTDPSGGAQIEVPIATTTAAPNATILAPTTTTGKPNINSGTNKDAPDGGLADSNTGATTTTRKPDVKNLTDSNTGATTTTRKPDAIEETELVSKDGGRSNLTSGNKTNTTNVTAVVTLDGDYNAIVGNRKEKFLLECSQALNPVHCIDVTSGSILVTLAGSKDDVAQAQANVESNGLALSSFGPALRLPNQFYWRADAPQCPTECGRAVSVQVGAVKCVRDSHGGAVADDNCDRLTTKPKALSISCPATSACSKCHADCSVGEFRNGCGGVANGHGIGQCEACSNKPPGDEVTGVYYFYTSQGPVNQNNCSYTLCPSCPIGFVRVGCSGNAIGRCKPCSNAKPWQYYSSDGHMGTGMCDVKACENAPKKNPGDGENGFYYIGAAAAGQTECAHEQCDALPSCGVGKYRLGCGGASKGECVSCTNFPATVTDNDSELSERPAFYYTSAGGFRADGCSYTLCPSDCGVGSYREGCGGTSPGTCKPCSKRLLASGVADNSGHPTGYVHNNDWSRYGQTFLRYFSGTGGLRDSCPTKPCTKDCPVGKFRSGCGVLGAGVCVPCTNAPEEEVKGSPRLIDEEHVQGYERKDYVYTGHGGLANECPYRLHCPAGQYSQEGVADGVNAVTQGVSCVECPLGFYGSVSGLTTAECSGRCSPGYHCPPGSTSPTQEPCVDPSLPKAEGAKTFCARGYRQLVSAGFYTTPHSTSTFHRTSQAQCGPGTYCVDGVRHLCPEGVYGETYGLQSAECTAKCLATNWCPQGTILPRPCEVGHYCIDGVSMHPCPPGYYGGLVNESRPECQGKCDEGYYCPAASTVPRQVECPAGVYGGTKGLTNAACSGPCTAGFYCPSASTKPDQVKCGAVTVYCPTGSPLPTKVDLGYYSHGGDWLTRSSQRLCDPGQFCDHHAVTKPCAEGTYNPDPGRGTRCTTLCPEGSYCPTGSIRPTICPPGTFGGRRGLTDAKCSGVCDVGYYCPAGSVRSRQKKCPAGTAGLVTGLGSQEECGSLQCDINNGYCQTAPCSAGYYCPPASTSRKELPCGGPNVYCPRGSSKPVPVTPGYYSVNQDTRGGFSADAGAGQHRNAQVQCEVGHYCTGGLRFECPHGTFGATPGLTTEQCSGLCEPGYWCEAGSHSPRQHECREGFYGRKGEWEATCFAVCPEGFYCPTATSQPLQCGGAHLFCPEGSKAPTPVDTGFYSVELTLSSKERPRQRVCPLGHYCVRGIRTPCPAGTFGSTEGLHTKKCSGKCHKGYYCPVASVSATQKPCPVGTYGSTMGLPDKKCSGRCLPHYYCPRGTTDPFSRPV